MLGDETQILVQELLRDQTDGDNSLCHSKGSLQKSGENRSKLSHGVGSAGLEKYHVNLSCAEGSKARLDDTLH